MHGQCRAIMGWPAKRLARTALSVAGAETNRGLWWLTSGRTLHGEVLEDVKSRLCEAIEQKKERTALDHVRHFFNQKDISLLDCNQILQTCWLNCNGKIAHSTWIYMNKKKIKLNTFSVACLLNALCRGGLLDEALELLHGLGHSIDVQPNIIYCGIFLGGCSQAGSSSHAEQCLRYIREKGLKEDEIIYLELMKLAGKKKDLPAVRKAWSLMVKTCSPSVPCLESYSTAVKALCKAGSFAEALIALREMVQVVSRNEGFTLLSEKVVKIKSLYKPEDMAHLQEISKNREVKEQEQENAEKEALSCTEDTTSGPKADTVISIADDDTPSIPRVDERVIQRDELEQAMSMDAQNNNRGPYDQILGWTRLAMLNLQQSDTSTLPESLQSMGSPISGFFSDKYAKVKGLLRETFNAIINTAVNRGDLQSAEIMFSQMRTVDLKPDIYSYNAMLRAVVRGRGLDQGFVVVKSMENDGLEPDTKTYNAVIEGFCINSELDKAEALLDRMLKCGGNQTPSVVSFNTILKACGESDELVRALRVFTKMVEARIKPDRCTILYLFSAFGRINYPYERGTEESQNELFQRLSAIEAYMDHSNLPHNFQTFNAVMVALSAEGMTDAVIQRLNLAEGCVGGDGQPLLTAITFNTAIHACNQAKQWSAAKEIFKKMRALGFKPNRETYNIFINGCAEQKKMHDALHYLGTMEDEGLKPNLYTYNAIMKVCCYSKDLEKALKVLGEMEDCGIMPSIVTFTTLLSTAVHEERIDVVEFLIEHMHRRRVQPNITICELVVSAYLSCHQVDDAAEALAVLSTRMLPKGGKVPGKMEDILKQICLEDSLEVESSTLELLKDALVNKGLISEALFAARLSGFGNVSSEVWNTEESTWARRMRLQYSNLH